MNTIIKPRLGLQFDRNHWTMRNTVLMFCPLYPGDNRDYSNNPIAPGLTLNGDVAPISTEYGTAFDFDGTGDYIDCGPHPFQGFGEITVEAIVRMDVAATGMLLQDGSSWTKGAFYFVIENGIKVEMLVYSDGSYDRMTSDEIISVGNWYHVVGTWKAGERVATYVNGVASTDDAGSVRNAVLQDGDENLLIGMNPGGGGDLNGQIALVRIHDKRFTAGQIAELVRDPWAAWRQDDIDAFAVATSSAGNGAFNPAWALNSNQIL